MLAVGNQFAVHRMAGGVHSPGFIIQKYACAPGPGPNELLQLDAEHLLGKRLCTLDIVDINLKPSDWIFLPQQFLSLATTISRKREPVESGTDCKLLLSQTRNWRCVLPTKQNRKFLNFL